MANYNLGPTNNSDCWVVDAINGKLIGVFNNGQLHQFVPSTNNPLHVTLGGTPAVLTNPSYQVTNSVNNYTQISIQNKSTGANASADLIAYPDNVASSDLTGFADVGITSSAYNQAAYSVTGANESYFFGSAPTASGTTGDMVFATDATGTSNGMRWYVNGFNKAVTVWSLKLTGAGLFMVGNGLALSNTSKVIVNNGSTTTYTVPAGASYVFITTSAASLAFTLSAGAALIDGQVIVITPSASVGTVTWASAGTTFVGAPASITANVPVRLIYDHASLKWYPI